MKYRCRAAEPFWTHFYRLDDAQKEATRKAWRIFKENPFDPRLRTRKAAKRHRKLAGDNVPGNRPIHNSSQRDDGVRRRTTNCRRPFRTDFVLDVESRHDVPG